MIAVHKFDIKIEDAPVVEMDPNGRIVKFDNQHERLMIWALVDTEAEQKPRYFQLASTGYPIKPHHRFIGTSKLHGDDLVFHLFEQLSTADLERIAENNNKLMNNIQINKNYNDQPRPLFNGPAV